MAVISLPPRLFGGEPRRRPASGPPTTIRMRARHCIAAVGAMFTIALPSALAAQAKELPLKYSGPPTKAEISAGDLMTRLYKFADDSMMGRQVGTDYNNKGTA